LNLNLILFPIVFTAGTATEESEVSEEEQDLGTKGMEVMFYAGATLISGSKGKRR